MCRRFRIAAFSCLATVAQAQHSFSHTFTVDPSGSADYTTIQGAINAIPALSRPATILVYAGTYAEAVTLSDPEIDIVGIDRKGVVINPPIDTDALTIKGNGERLNTIRNLTIWTDDDTAGEGRGIVIENNGGADPTDITIDGVTFRIDGANSDAILLDDRAHSIEISDVTVLGAAEDTIKGVCVTGGTSADPSLDITISNVVMLLDGCSAKGVTFEDEAENVTITGLFVRKPSFGGRGIEAEFATNLTVENCDILAHDGDGLIVGPNTIVRDSSIVVRKDYGSDDGCGSSEDDKPGVTVKGSIDGVVFDNCYLEGRLAGVTIGSGASDVTILASEMRGGTAGVSINGASDVSIANSSLDGDSALGLGTGIPAPQHYGLRVYGTTSNITVASSVLTAISTTARDAMGVMVGDAPSDRPLQVLDCVITARVSGTGVAHGARSDAVEGLALIGGSVDALDADERQTDLYDLYNPTEDNEIHVRTTGTTFSRWFGEIGAAVGEEVDVQRVVNIPSAGNATVLAATTLQAAERAITANITSPYAYRVLSVTGNRPLMNGSVIIIGKDWGNRPIADSIIVSGTITSKGVKAFRFVDKIILPPWTTTLNGETISIGTTETLGLHAPISGAGDLLQIGQKASAASAYTLPAAVPTPDVVRGTVDISALGPAANDSIEFTYRASK